MLMKFYEYKYENLRPTSDFYFSYFFQQLKRWLFYLAYCYNFVESLSCQERNWCALMIGISNSQLPCLNMNWLSFFVAVSCKNKKVICELRHPKPWKDSDVCKQLRDCGSTSLQGLRNAHCQTMEGGGVFIWYSAYSSRNEGLIVN